MKKAPASNTNVVIDNWADDFLKRQPVAKDFTNIILSLPTPQVVGINAEYGMGKSFFIERWAKDLKQKGHTVLFFNAWENDFSDDPLMAFVVDLQEQLIEIGFKKSDTPIKGLIETAGRITYQALISAAETATLNMVDIKKINDEENEDNFKKIYGDFAAAKINAHIEVKNGIKQFKSRLHEVAESIRKQKGDKGLPIIVFIDELDRCRPDFAIELLENIKHIYNVENFIFVLSMDRAQMKHAVGVIYGHEMDGEGYLRRFVDFELRLPAPQTKPFVEFLLKRSQLEKIYSDNQNYAISPSLFAEIFSEYAEFFNLSLREQEQAFKEAAVGIRKSNSASHPFVLGFLAALKTKNKDIYSKIGTTLTDLWSIINATEDFAEKKGYHSQKIIRHGRCPTIEVLAALLETEKQKVSHKLNQIMEKKNQNSQQQKTNAPELERDSNIYNAAVKFAEKLDWDFNIYDGRNPPVLHLKEILDIGSIYQKPL